MEIAEFMSQIQNLVYELQHTEKFEYSSDVCEVLCEAKDKLEEAKRLILEEADSNA